MSKLFEKIKIGSLELNNRIVMPPMGTQLANPDGTVSPRQIEYYSHRARGGAGLIEVEFSTVDPVQFAAPTQVRISDDKFMPGLAALASAIKSNGARAAIQIHHPGRQASARTTGVQPVAPSAIAGPSPELPRELTVAEILELEERFAQAALRAKQAGFDAVELHSAHGYLLCQFLSPYSNKRQDDFGGDTRRRARFPLEIVSRVRQRVGNDYPILFRLSADEHVEGGLTLVETRLIARWLEEAGVNAISVSAANHASMEWSIQPMLLRPGCLAPLAGEIKKVVKVPVIVAGRINDPLVAERILEQGKADLVAVGRGLLADPDFPRKAREGNEREINKCIACNTCYDQILRMQPIACLVNPGAGRELEKEGSAATPKRIVILGAGPAGLEAARISTVRGHRVTLLEEDSKIGKHWSWLIRPYLTLQQSRLRALGVKIELGKNAVTSVFKTLNPDVVMATQQSLPREIKIVGLEPGNVFSAEEVLYGRMDIGKQVVILGGGNIGLEVANHLYRKDIKVTVIESGPRAGSGLEWHARKVLLDQLAERGVKILTNITVIRFKGKKLFYQRSPSNEELEINAGSIINALGSDPCEVLAESLKKDFQVVSLPYCERPVEVYRATQEGAKAARRI